MAQASINIGDVPNDGTGDSLRTAYTKVNANFAELYTRVAVLEGATVAYQPASGRLTALTNGSIDGVAIGGTTPAAGSFTTLKIGATTITGVGTAVGTVAAGNDSRITGAVQITAFSAAIDSALGSTQGAVLYRGASGWATLAPGTAGYALITGGAGANPVWASVGGSGVSSSSLDSAFGSTQGSILYRGASAWLALTPGTSGQVLTTGGPATNPAWSTPTAATTPPTRQTVQSGPASAGLPTFLPGTSGSLSLTAQNVTSSAPLILTAAQGFGATPNVSYTFTSNPTWTGLTASTTNYLYVNASTGATGFTTLLPVYQSGGTPSTTSGQFTFDYQAMVGYLGNGTTAVATPLVFVGEAVTSASAVTATVTYAYNGFYDSGFTTNLPTAFSATTKSHNLGVQPLVKRVVLQNVTADAGYAVGDQLDLASVFSGNGSYGVPLAVSTTRNVATLITSSTTSFLVNNKGTGATTQITNANWQYKFAMQRGW